MTKKKKKLKIDSLWDRLRKDNFEVKKPKKILDSVIVEKEPEIKKEVIIPSHDSVPYDEVSTHLEDKLLNT